MKYCWTPKDYYTSKVKFLTHQNKLYNNGIVKFVNGKKGGSGTNGLSQFTIKETGERLKDK